MTQFLESTTDEHTFLHENLRIRNEIMKLVEEQHVLVEQYLMKQLKKEKEQ